ncbi:hypothetical protein [Wukongibacter sp. M2B1]|uniref:hypothetical protein n=1 Tax=Wukongibacter sp. M2B1 TaxID=3088895 RepID=UPI003D790CA5
MRKALSMLLVTAMMLAMLSVPAFADDGCTTYPYITMDNSDDFTIVKQGTSSTEYVKAVGLDASYVKNDFTSLEDDYITWTTSDSSVVKFYNDYYQEVNSITGKDTVTLKMKGIGAATVTITYNPPDDSPISVTSYVVVEGTTYTGDATGISVEAATDSTTYCSQTNLTVEEFSLDDIFGSSFDDDDVLKNSPSAIHALLYALELENDSDGCTDVDDANWDWDWVSANVQLDSEGSYVQKIGDDWYWQYKLNGVEVQNASSATALENGDDVGFEKSSW